MPMPPSLQRTHSRHCLVKMYTKRVCAYRDRYRISWPVFIYSVCTRSTAILWRVGEGLSLSETCCFLQSWCVFFVVPVHKYCIQTFPQTSSPSSLPLLSMFSHLPLLHSPRNSCLAPVICLPICDAFCFWIVFSCFHPLARVVGPLPKLMGFLFVSWCSFVLSETHSDSASHMSATRYLVHNIPKPWTYLEQELCQSHALNRNFSHLCARTHMQGM